MTPRRAPPHPSRRRFAAGLIAAAGLIVCPAAAQRRKAKAKPAPLAAILDNAADAVAGLHRNILGMPGFLGDDAAAEKVQTHLTDIALRLGRLYTGRSSRISTLDDYLALWREANADGNIRTLERLQLQDAWAAITTRLQDILQDLTMLLAAVETDHPGAMRSPGYLSLRKVSRTREGVISPGLRAIYPIEQPQIVALEGSVKAYHRLRGELYDCVARLRTRPAVASARPHSGWSNR